MDYEDDIEKVWIQNILLYMVNLNFRTILLCHMIILCGHYRNPVDIISSKTSMTYSRKGCLA